ncbi:ficolin-1-like [Drosophila grimshawi]|uniref:ficolin-1-like n=1 Tax=Drosophila grimshawi TaxID=7222 RepID=UPI000C86F829|nr:ficolin-1-like [Drosophila grimshawi]
MRRKDGSVDFYRFWDDYKNGFGNLNGEFFIGLDKLHFITKAVDQELLITMEDLNGRHRFAKYDRFAIDGEMQSYKQITLGTYSGGAGESMRIHAGKKFTTRDRDYDTHDDNCAEMFTGAWWYDACHDSNLFGKYIPQNCRDISWLMFTGYSSYLKRVQMMIRPRRAEHSS